MDDDTFFVWSSTSESLSLTVSTRLLLMDVGLRARGAADETPRLFPEREDMETRQSAVTLDIVDVSERIGVREEWTSERMTGYLIVGVAARTLDLKRVIQFGLQL